jgi:hypothetical protein
VWQGDIYLVSPEGRFLESYTLEADPKLIAEDWAKVRAYPEPRLQSQIVVLESVILCSVSTFTAFAIFRIDGGHIISACQNLGTLRNSKYQCNRGSRRSDPFVCYCTGPECLEHPPPFVSSQSFSPMLCY